MSTNLVAFISQSLGAVALLMLLTLNPRVRPLPIAFRFPRSEALLGLAVLAAVSLLRLLPDWRAESAFLLPVLGTITRGTLGDIPIRLLVSWISLLPFGFALMFTKAEKPFFSIGWNGRDIKPALQLGLAMGLLALFLSGRIWLLLRTFSFTDFYALLVWFGIGLCEETIFRGYIQTRLSAWLGPNQGWLLASLLYALWAIPAFIGRPDFALQALVMLGRGLLHGWIYRKIGHVLAPAVYSGLSNWSFYI